MASLRIGCPHKKSNKLTACLGFRVQGQGPDCKYAALICLV